MSLKFTAAELEKPLSASLALVATAELLGILTSKISDLPLSCGGTHLYVNDVECMQVRASCLVEGVKQSIEGILATRDVHDRVQ